MFLRMKCTLDLRVLRMKCTLMTDFRYLAGSVFKVATKFSSLRCGSYQLILIYYLILKWEARADNPLRAGG